MRRNGRTLVAYFVASRSFPSPFVSLPPLHLATLGSVPEETNGMSEERRETERKVEWRDEWKGTEMSQRVNHQKLRLWVGSFIEFQSHVGSFLSVHSLHAPFITLQGD